MHSGHADIKEVLKWAQKQTDKIDLEKKVVPREEAEAWARSQGMLFLEASAKTRTGIKQCFMEVVQKIVEDPELLVNTVPGRPKIALHENRNLRTTNSGSMAEDESMCC